jgi:lysophospholipase L1-like esterase
VISDYISPRDARGPGGPPDPALYEQVAALFSENMKMVDALSASYGFRFRAFIPPDPYYADKPLTTEESGAADHQALKRDLSKERYQAMMAAISKTAPRTSLMKDVFAGEKQQLYVDYVHFNPLGNAIIARRLAESLLPLVK